MARAADQIRSGTILPERASLRGVFAARTEEYLTRLNQLLTGPSHFTRRRIFSRARTRLLLVNLLATLAHSRPPIHKPSNRLLASPISTTHDTNKDTCCASNADTFQSLTQQSISYLDILFTNIIYNTVYTYIYM